MTEKERGGNPFALYFTSEVFDRNDDGFKAVKELALTMFSVFPCIFLSFVLCAKGYSKLRFVFLSYAITWLLILVFRFVLKLGIAYKAELLSRANLLLIFLKSLLTFTSSGKEFENLE